MQTIANFLSSVLGFLLQILPRSPFKDVITGIELSPFLGYLNWLVPVGTFVSIGGLWLTAIGVFYAWQLVLRWAKVASDG